MLLFFLLLTVIILVFSHHGLLSSDSRSSLSEGQLQGSFSDGELLRLTPRGRHALEDGELPPPPPPPPAPAQPRSEAEAAMDGGGSAGRRWSRGADPREHLTLLMSAHPHLKANRVYARGGGGDRRRQRVSVAAAADAIGGAGGSGDRRRRRPPLSGMDAEDGASRRALLGGAEGAREDGLPEEEELDLFEAGCYGRGDDGSPSALSGSGCSLEPGQARSPARHSWQEKLARASAGCAGVSGGGEQFGLGAPWLQRRDVPASEDTAYSAGEASSGAELGETPPPAFLDQHLDDSAAEEGQREEGPASRPLKVLAVGTGSSEARRWVQKWQPPAKIVNVENVDVRL